MILGTIMQITEREQGWRLGKGCRDRGMAASVIQDRTGDKEGRGKSEMKGRKKGKEKKAERRKERSLLLPSAPPQALRGNSRAMEA